MATIEIKYNGTVLDQDSHTIELENCEKAEFVFDVVVDGSLTMPNYNVVTEGPGLVMKRVGNNVYVAVPDNFSPKGKNFKLYFSHNMFPSKNYTVYITQPGKVYEILMRYPHMVSEPSESLSFNADNLFDKNDPSSQVWRVYMECNEGYCDFGVEEIEEYISGGATRIPYDGGLSVVKTGNDILTITSYGRISMHDNVEYRIKVYHKNDRTAKKTITITYNSDTDSGFDFA
jgi:hypothetical protein